MKKILISVFLLISFINNSHAKVYTVECKELNFSLSQGKNFEDLNNINNYWFNYDDKSSILIIEPEFNNKENGTTGRITFIHDNRKQFFYISNYSSDFKRNRPSKFDAYSYSKLTKEDAKDYKKLKPLVGKFTDNRFLNFNEVKMPIKNPFYNLYYIVVQGLYSVDRTEFPINAKSYRFMCKD